MMATQPKRRGLSIVAILAAIGVGAVALGVPLSTVVLVALVLCCPLMMLFMDHSGHGDGGHRGSARRERDLF